MVQATHTETERNLFIVTDTSLRDIQAELHLLEEICSLYADAEDRTSANNDPDDNSDDAFSGIPTEAGIKARQARYRFRMREAAEAREAGRSREGFTDAEMNAADSLLPADVTVMRYIDISSDDSGSITALVRVFPNRANGESFILKLESGESPERYS